MLSCLTITLVAYSNVRSNFRTPAWSMFMSGEVKLVILKSNH